MQSAEFVAMSSNQRETEFFLRRLTDERGSGVPHRHAFEQVLLIESGQGSHVLDGQNFEFSSRSLCFISKGPVHVVETSTRLKGWAIRFVDDFLPPGLVSQTWNCHVSLFNQIDPIQSLSLKSCEMHDLELLLELIESEYKHPATPRKQAILGHLLSVLIIRLGGMYEAAARLKGSHHDAYRVCKEFMDLLEQDFAEHSDVQYYADVLHIPAVKLSKILGHIIGRPAKQLIEERIILEARRYLYHSDLAIKEIAFNLGYSDPFHLSKAFKRLVGIGPLAFRERRQRTR